MFVQTLLQWKEISITHYECVFVALVIQNSTHMRHIVICSLSSYPGTILGG
jgi:hypothetical protein